MVCQKCGSENDRNNRFCGYCGDLLPIQKETPQIGLRSQKRGKQANQEKILSGYNTRKKMVVKKKKKKDSKAFSMLMHMAWSTGKKTGSLAYSISKFMFRLIPIILYMIACVGLFLPAISLRGTFLQWSNTISMNFFEIFQYSFGLVKEIQRIAPVQDNKGAWFDVLTTPIALLLLVCIGLFLLVVLQMIPLFFTLFVGDTVHKQRKITFMMSLFLTVVWAASVYQLSGINQVLYVLDALSLKGNIGMDIGFFTVYFSILGIFILSLFRGGISASKSRKRNREL